MKLLKQHLSKTAMLLWLTETVFLQKSKQLSCRPFLMEQFLKISGKNNNNTGNIDQDASVGWFFFLVQVLWKLFGFTDLILLWILSEIYVASDVHTETIRWSSCDLPHGLWRECDKMCVFLLEETHVLRLPPCFASVTPTAVSDPLEDAPPLLDPVEFKVVKDPLDPPE